MNRCLYALGLIALCYLMAEKGYKKGVKATIKKIREYAEAHPDETFKEFLESEEEV